MSKRNFRYQVKEYFTFSSSDKNGILILLALILIVSLVYWVISFSGKPVPRMDVSAFEKEIQQFEQSTDSLDFHPYKPYKTRDSLKKVTSEHRPKEIKKQDLNSLDSAKLEELPGIGPVFARRIIKFRDALGGYNSLDQLLEVYGLKNELFEKIKPYLVIDKTKIKQVNLNSNDFRRINAHPYLSFTQTKAIFTLRSKQKITGLESLTEAKILTQEEAEKLKPYLSFD